MGGRVGASPARLSFFESSTVPSSLKSGGDAGPIVNLLIRASSGVMKLSFHCAIACANAAAAGLELKIGTHN